MGLWRQPSQHLKVATVFFGGGTPSLLPLPEVDRIVTALRQHFRLAADAEFSCEANPGTIDRPYLQGLRSLGVNRLSLGVQSFHDDELATLGRIHTAEEAREAYHTARQAGFDNVNLDLIYGLPRQTMTAWHHTVREAIALRPDHLSLYALSVEEGTPLAEAVAHGRLPPPDADLAADMYLWAEDALAAAGYQHYEISNWALPGRQCRHNLAYWLNESYLGLGAGAHSCFGGFRFANVKDPRRYIPLVEESAKGDGRLAEGLAPFLAGLGHIASAEQMTAARAMAETVVLGLRLVEGLPLEGFRRRFGQELMSVYGPQVEELEGLGLLERIDGCLRLTTRGRLLGNEAFLRFLPD
jgi:oxygen-independent coproporphyrinogen-3 oxidase